MLNKHKNNNFILNIFNNVFDIFYPRFCLGCGCQLIENEQFCCQSCLSKIPILDYYQQKENPVFEQMYNRVGGIESACAFIKFSKESFAQELIHNLKYNGHHEIGFELGKYAGKKLLSTGIFTNIDYIIPVPLHKKKFKKRGYNQSERIAAGLSSVLKFPVNEEVLLKIRYNETQTKKNRLERYKNSLELYSVNSDPKYHNKHFLIVDDVLTTGSTLEACSNELKQHIPGAKISLFALAKA